ncbi:MAG: amidohydrolase family protein [Planctomycetota bacterium]
MEFFDCNCSIGLPTNAIPRPVGTAKELIAAMDRSGIAKALVWHVAQRDASVQDGNRMLTEEIAPYPKRLSGCWTILPTQTGELPPPAALFGAMAEHNIRALRAFPTLHKYLLCRESVGPILARMVKARVPLLLSRMDDADWRIARDILREFPQLVCVLCDVGLWGADRWFRPLVEHYPNVYVEISEYILAGGIPDFVRWKGAGRLLFGTRFPVLDHGGMMLTLRHVPIPARDRLAIASGNMERILARETL